MFKLSTYWFNSVVYMYMFKCRSPHCLLIIIDCIKGGLAQFTSWLSITGGQNPLCGSWNWGKASYALGPWVSRVLVFVALSAAGIFQRIQVLYMLYLQIPRLTVIIISTWYMAWKSGFIHEVLFGRGCAVTLNQIK